MTETDHALVSLGSHVRSRRLLLGFRTAAALAEAMGITPRVIYDIEGGVRRVGPQTYSLLDNVLRWNPGSSVETVNGGRPTPLNPASQAEVDAERKAGTEHIPYIFQQADNAAKRRTPWSIDMEIQMVQGEIARAEVDLVAYRARLTELERRLESENTYEPDDQ